LEDAQRMIGELPHEVVEVEAPDPSSLPSPGPSSPACGPVPAKGAGSFESGHRTLPDQVALELGHAGEDLEDQLAALHVHGQIHPRPAREVRDVHIAAELPLTSAVLPRGPSEDTGEGKVVINGSSQYSPQAPSRCSGCFGAGGACSRLAAL
jgi:hypothetical protein